MSNPQKVFETEQLGNILIVIPQGAALNFTYQQVHVDSNALLAKLADKSIEHILIDLEFVEYIDSIIIGAIIRMLQKIKMSGGKAVFCNASEQMQEILKSIKIGTLWPLFESRELAIADIN